MVRSIISLMCVVLAVSTTACGTLYFESYYRQVESLEVAAAGDTLWLRLVDEDVVDVTRFQPGELHKHYRYRIVEDGFVGEESEDKYDPNVLFIFDPNASGVVKSYRIDVKIAEEYHDGWGGCRPNDELGEWQAAYEILQQSM